jgi:hypothetical protein
MTHKLIKTDNYLLVVDDSDIKEGDYWHYLGELGKPVLNFLPNTWYDNLHDRNKYKKVIAHLPLNGLPILEGVDLLPPYSRHQEEGVEELAQEWYDKGELTSAYSFKAGYNKAREKYKYTEEDMRKAIDMARLQGPESFLVKYREEEIIQSLHQYPTEFECEMEYYYHSSPKYYHDAGFVKCDESQYNIIRKTIPECDTKIEPKTITTAQGVQWVGKYK